VADKIQNGQAEYGVVHVMEEEMRAAQQGVFEPKSGEKRARKAAAPAAETKMEAAPANKAISKATAGSSSRQAAKRKAK
jgi:nucleotide-binding universal stress UspA family protein